VTPAVAVPAAARGVIRIPNSPFRRKVCRSGKPTMTLDLFLRRSPMAPRRRQTQARLAEFILRNMESILVEWERFAARQLPAAASMESLALRDHAKQILQAVAKDLESHQGRDAQMAKSKGEAPKVFGAPETAAETHAILRAQSGFDIKQLVAEYRALRASVLRLWSDAYPVTAATDFRDVIRFNEAIDQALAESVCFFSEQLDQSRNLFLGVLGHDMRSPLQTIRLTARYLVALNAGEPVSQAAGRLIDSGSRLQSMLDDLLDFNRAKLGLGISVRLEELDLAALSGRELDRLQAAYPDRRLTLRTEGETRGLWDGSRLQQLLCNLVQNALKHGAQDAPVRVTITGGEQAVRLDVGNQGPVIEAASLQEIFEPLVRGRRYDEVPDRDGSLGLGLYIARQIVLSHGGTIEARSDRTETVFTVQLPRRHDKPAPSGAAELLEPSPSPPVSRP
jgi:signal transduction histidine kinase